jgi:hypothetical protein
MDSERAGSLPPSFLQALRFNRNQPGAPSERNCGPEVTLGGPNQENHPHPESLPSSAEVLDRFGGKVSIYLPIRWINSC